MGIKNYVGPVEDGEGMRAWGLMAFITLVLVVAGLSSLGVFIVTLLWPVVAFAIIVVRRMLKALVRRMRHGR